MCEVQLEPLTELANLAGLWLVWFGLDLPLPAFGLL